MLYLTVADFADGMIEVDKNGKYFPRPQAVTPYSLPVYGYAEGFHRVDVEDQKRALGWLKHAAQWRSLSKTFADAQDAVEQKEWLAMSTSLEQGIYAGMDSQDTGKNSIEVAESNRSQSAEERFKHIVNGLLNDTDGSFAKQLLAENPSSSEINEKGVAAYREEVRQAELASVQQQEMVQQERSRGISLS